MCIGGLQMSLMIIFFKCDFSCKNIRSMFYILLVWKTIELETGFHVDQNTRHSAERP